MAENILNDDWLINPPYDYEMKKYILLGATSKIKDIISENRLYTAIIEIESILHNLYNFKYNRDIIEEANRKVTGIDVDMMSLSYDYPEEPENIIRMYDICDTAIDHFEELYKQIRVKWRDLEKSCQITEIPDTKPTFTKGFIMYVDIKTDELVVYKYKEPSSFSINWDAFKLTEVTRLPNKVREIAKFIEEDERNENKNRYFRFKCNQYAKFKESIFPIMQYMLFNRIKHGI